MCACSNGIELSVSKCVSVGKGRMGGTVCMSVREVRIRGHKFIEEIVTTKILIMNERRASLP